jgi:hypothetical protein
MLRRVFLTALALASLGALRPASAQSGVGGWWLFEFNRRRTMMNGELSESDPATIRLALEQHGDSVTGTWQQVSPVEDPAPKPRGLRGTISGGTVRLVSDPSEARIHEMGSERTVKMVTTLEFTVSGDELTGTRKVGMAGEEMDGQEHPFKARREKH